MPVYILHKGSRSGPFEDEWVIEQLENGRVSPDDLAIRQGDKEWRPLRELFPNVDVQPGAPSRESAPDVAPATKTGGCASILGVLLIGAGILLFLAGAGGCVVNRLMEPGVCETAEQTQAEADRAYRDAQASKGTSRQTELEAKAKEKVESAQIWSRGCADAKSMHLIYFGLLAAVGLFGLLVAVTGFFVRRRTTA